MKKLLILLLSLLACGLALTACDDSGKKNEADHVHAFGEWTTVIEATCIAEGKQERVCECGEKETHSVGKTDHVIAVNAAVASSCNKTGLTEGKYCFVCNEVIVAQQVVPATSQHSYKDATCTAPKTCSCGATEGEALGHKWDKATCTKPKTCSTCSMIEGSELGHKWSEATCTKPKTCSTCSKTEGSALGHKWQAATCTDPKTCSTCSKTEGSALGHKWQEATCNSPEKCENCGKTQGTAHKYDSTGKCSYCGHIDGEPDEGMAYKLYMNQVNIGKVFFVTTEAANGSNKYLKGTENAAEAPDFYAEKVEGGYKFYTMIDGAKQYLTGALVLEEGKEYKSKCLRLTEEGNVWYYKPDCNAWFTKLEGAEYVVGSYSSYVTFSISDGSYMTPTASGVSQFPCVLVPSDDADKLAPS